MCVPVIIASGNGWFPAQDQAIALTNADVFSIQLMQTN